MRELLLQQTENHIHSFFHAAKLQRKKWYKEIQNLDELLYAFFVIRRRMVQPKNYQIHESKKIKDSNLKPELTRDYQSLKKAFLEKGDLKKFHTENSKVLSPIDSLLEEWNINHLHIDRARYQIFFLAEKKEIFIINICKHFERNRTDYSKNSLLEIIKENWPIKFQKQALKKPDKISDKYKSAYGWQRVEEFYSWLDEAISVIEKSEFSPEMIFIDNETFIICDIKSKIQIPDTRFFEV